MTDFDRLEAEGLAMHTPEFERDIAETMAERERDARRYSDTEVRSRAERRASITAAVFAAMYARTTGRITLDDRRTWEREAIEAATGVMHALDAAEARDREATK